MENEEKVLRALGLCAKAGRLICGTPLICEAMKGGKKPRLVVAASDNSPNTAKRLSDRCAYYGVRLVIIRADGETLAASVGKTGRVAAAAVTDENLCRAVESALAGEGERTD